MDYLKNMVKEAVTALGVEYGDTIIYNGITVSINFDRDVASLTGDYSEILVCVHLGDFEWFEDTLDLTDRAVYNIEGYNPHQRQSWASYKATYKDLVKMIKRVFK